MPLQRIKILFFEQNKLVAIITISDNKIQLIIGRFPFISEKYVPMYCVQNIYVNDVYKRVLTFGFFFVDIIRGVVISRTINYNLFSVIKLCEHLTMTIFIKIIHLNEDFPCLMYVHNEYFFLCQLSMPYALYMTSLFSNISIIIYNLT